MKKKFSLSQDNMPFNFFDEVDFAYEPIVLDSIKGKYAWLDKSECKAVFEKYEDYFTESLYELRDANSINDSWIGDYEVDESTGTWGYSNFEVVDIKKVRKELEKEVKELVEELLIKFDLKL